MIKDVAFHNDIVIVIEKSGSVTAMKVYKNKKDVKQDEKFLVCIVHDDPKKTFKYYHIYSNTLAILRQIASEIGCDYKDDWNTQQLGRAVVDRINNLKFGK